jgi:orotate phosphoribosyltransferase
MDNDLLVELLKETGVIKDGHFELTSGRHSGRFMQCSQLLQYPDKTSIICKMMAEPYLDKNIETVVGPAMGGVIISYEVARHLWARSIYTEKINEQMKLRRGFTIKPGERVLVVEDATTTGNSVMKVLNVLKESGAEIVGVAVMVDRSFEAPDFGVPMTSLIKVGVESYLPEECPYCRDNIPLEQPKK